jgi:hypothetical protein
MNANEQAPNADEAGFLTESELIVRLKVSRGSLVNYRNQGILPFVRIGRSVRYHWRSVEQALLRKQRGSAQ